MLAPGRPPESLSMDDSGFELRPALPEEVEVGCGPGDLLRSGWSLPEVEEEKVPKESLLQRLRTLIKRLCCSPRSCEEGCCPGGTLALWLKMRAFHFIHDFTVIYLFYFG
ncbi:unnamed protein product [Durusdinium trenchii]|uniref:Uncharacterized protein n=1 Tax=Durusdinium trenchii TaxID=1381693 RepID=A0ABP0MKF6_9DINO